MPINPTTLKALIDTEITNETVDFAITPAEVGGRMKDTVDYTTEQSALKEDLTNKSTNVALGTSDTLYPTQNAVKAYVDANAGVQVSKFVKRTITHSELLDIFTTPIVLLPAAAGKMYIPKDVLVKYIDNDGWSSAGNWRILLDTVQLTNFISQMGGGTVEEQFAYLLQGNPSNTTTSFFNKDVFVTASANPTVPVNALTTVDVYVTYFEITL
jgi:hypothetical protein